MNLHREAAVWSVLGTALALAVLSACGSEAVQEEPLPDEAASWSLEHPTLEGGGCTPPPLSKLYANAVVPGTTVGVLHPENAVGVPDGKVASFVALLGGSLTLDMGQGEEGQGPLKIFYRGLALPVLATVDFLRADGSVISTGHVQLAHIGVGSSTALVPYSGSTPYRFVRLRGGLAALYSVDAVKAKNPPVCVFCGDGEVEGTEECDDANQQSGDGCNSVCEVEPGYTCAGEPTVCTDIDECANGTANCQPGEICVNTPGSYTCEPDLCAGVVCAPLDACHIAGTCNPSTGQCSNPVAPNGTACSDGNACTQPDTCQGGVCTGGPLVGDTTSNIAHRWTFDEASGSTALDSAGTSNGTLGSSASRTVSFDGSGAVTLTPTQQCDLDAQVDFGLAPGQFGTAAFTVSYWLKTTFNSNGFGDLIGNRVDGNAGNYLSARLSGASEASLEIYEDAAGTNGAGVNVSPSPLNNGSWHHVVYTRGGTSLKVYIDGVLIGSATSAAPTNLTGANSFRIGRRLPTCLGGFYSIPASFEDVRTYSRELTACDVAKLATP
ncbi:LamG-like jellyroll fold domain-containing protein [Pyxidicoccus sp. 3LG]